MPKKNETGLSDDQVKEIVKRKTSGGAKWLKDLNEDGGPLAKPGDNSLFIRHAMVSLDLPPIDISDPEQVKQRINDYFHFCMENDKRPQIIGMCNWIGITRDTLYKWSTGAARGEEHQKLAKRAYAVMEEMWMDYMQYGKISPPAAIFLAKNWYGYKDIADVVITPNNPLQELDDREAAEQILENKPLRKRIGDAVPADEE